MNIKMGNKGGCAACGVKSRVNVQKVSESNLVLRNPDVDIESVPVMRPSDFPVPRNENMKYISSAPLYRRINFSRSLGFAGNERNKR